MRTGQNAQLLSFYKNATPNLQKPPDAQYIGVSAFWPQIAWSRGSAWELLRPESVRGSSISGGIGARLGYEPNASHIELAAGGTWTCEPLLGSSVAMAENIAK